MAAFFPGRSLDQRGRQPRFRSLRAGGTFRRASGAFAPGFIGFVACVLRPSLRLPTINPDSNGRTGSAPKKS
jgi:hypothetical protein